MSFLGSLVSGLTKRVLPPLLLAWSCGASAAYPEKPITVIAPFGVGSVVEGTFRVIFDEASKILGQPIVMENRPGAMSRLGVIAMRTAAPDGYTFAVGSDTLHVAQPVLDSNFKLRPGQEYEPVSFLFSHSLMIVGNPRLPFKDIKGLVSYAKANPGKLNMAVATGSATHLPLATTGTSRWNAYQQAPTMTEAGYGMTQSVWYNVIAPAGTPQEPASRFRAAIAQAMKTPAVVNKLKDGYFSAVGAEMSPAEFIRKVDAETVTWTPVLRQSGIKLQ
jgi:tripartite-type tricarboxylate transporter receptor subunit TctC